MDPLFERRQLEKLVHIESRFLQKNIKASLLQRLQEIYEGKCQEEGYIQKNSILILNYSVGRANYIKGGINYTVTFQADICLPHEGQRFQAPVKLKSKVGIHAELSPIKILVPRDLHIGNEDFDNIKVDDEIEFEVVGSQFKQEDENIVVVGRLLTKVAPPVEAPLVSTSEQEVETKQEDNVPKSEEGSEMRVVITPQQPEERKRKRLNRNPKTNTNEQLPPIEEGNA
jgi:DNA-directed RNA polymerase subunit E'/Rpb7